MRIPFLAKKDVIRGVTYNNTVVIRYILPKRELIKIGLVVGLVDLTLHSRLPRSWSDKVDEWATGTRNTLEGNDVQAS